MPSAIADGRPPCRLASAVAGGICQPFPLNCPLIVPFKTRAQTGICYADGICQRMPVHARGCQSAMQVPVCDADGRLLGRLASGHHRLASAVTRMASASAQMASAMRMPIWPSAIHALSKSENRGWHPPYADWHPHGGCHPLRRWHPPADGIRSQTGIRLADAISA
jgi:hypothetical protein